MDLTFCGSLEVTSGGRDGRTWYRVTASGRVINDAGELVLLLPYYESYSNVPVRSGMDVQVPVRLVSRLDRKQAKHVIELRFD